MKRFLLLLLFFNLCSFSPSYANIQNDFNVKEWSEKGKKLKALEHTDNTWSPKIKKHASKEGGKDLIPVFKAMIVVESDGQNNKTSKKNAKGLMGVTPIASKAVGETPDDLFDPDKNIRVGIKYFLKIYKKFDHDLEITLAAYNAGETVVRKYLKEHNRLPNYRETHEYIIKVLYIAEKAGLKSKVRLSYNQ